MTTAVGAKKKLDYSLSLQRQISLKRKQKVNGSIFEKVPLIQDKEQNLVLDSGRCDQA